MEWSEISIVIIGSLGSLVLFLVKRDVNRMNDSVSNAASKKSVQDLKEEFLELKRNSMTGSEVIAQIDKRTMPINSQLQMIIKLMGESAKGQNEIRKEQKKTNEMLIHVKTKQDLSNN